MSGHRWIRRTASGRAVAAVAASIVVLAGAACSGDDEDAATTTTAGADATEEQTTTTLSDAEYDEVISQFAADLDAAGSDICAVVEVQGIAAPPEPANPTQVEQLVAVSAQLLRSFASTVPDDPEAQAVLSDAADAMETGAQEAGYPLDYISDPEQLPQALSGEEFTAAIETVSANAQTQCLPEAGELEGGGETTETEGTEPDTGEG